MNYFKKLKIKLQLKDCDYNVAKLAIFYSYKRNIPGNEFPGILDDFLANPCFDTAIRLIEFDPEFFIFFIESKPDGFFVRNLESIKKNSI